MPDQIDLTQTPPPANLLAPQGALVPAGQRGACMVAAGSSKMLTSFEGAHPRKVSTFEHHSKAVSLISNVRSVGA